MNLGDDIRNYYEQLVLDYFHAQELHLRYDEEFMADLCCLVLNRLPPRYIRNAVDMAFFLSSQERAEMDKRVADTVNESLAFLLERIKEEGVKKPKKGGGDPTSRTPAHTTPTTAAPFRA